MKLLFRAERLEKNGIFSLPDMFVWCGSMVCDASGCHLYFSAWERKYGFDAWVTHSEIGYASAPEPGAAYRFRSWSLPGSGIPGAWDRDVTHNPTIFKYDGIYYLYYTGNFSDSKNWWDHRNHQRIGAAWSNAPDGQFHRSALPVVEHKNAVMTSNPSVCRMPDGTGFRLPQGGDFPGEDPFVFERMGKLYCLLKDNGRNYSVFSRALILFESEDGIRWKKKGAALSRKVTLEDGRIRRYCRMERPQLAFCDDGVRLFCAVKPSVSSTESFSVNLKIHSPLFHS